MPDGSRTAVENLAESAWLKVSHRAIMVFVVPFLLWYGSGFVAKVDALIDAIHDLRKEVAVLNEQKAALSGSVANNTSDLRDLRTLYYRHLTRPHNQPAESDPR